MSNPRFHVERLDSQSIILSETEARHARQSRRLSAGDVVTLFDGRGRQAVGQIVAGTGKVITVAVDQITEIAPPRPALTIAFAVPKGPRQDTLIEKCTELGVASLQPITTARSVAEASEHRINKWHRTAVEAAKQSGQAWLPELHEIRTLQDLLNDRSTFEMALLAVSAGNLFGHKEIEDHEEQPASCPRGSVQPRPIADLSSELREAKRVLALVGPEGGWTDEEIVQAIAAGARPISLGPNVLRMETAAITLAAIVHTLMNT